MRFFRILGALGACLALVLCAGCQQMRQAIDRAEAEGKLNTGQARLLRGSVALGEGVIESHRDYSPEQEYYVGRTTAAHILSHYPYRRAEQLTAYVNMVGLTLAGYAERPTLFSPVASKGGQGWHFAVVESDAVNAFAAPGGFIFITTGALAAMQSEDELAGVLAHEIVHVDKRHGLAAIKEETRKQIPAKIFKELAPEAVAALEKLFQKAIEDVVRTTLTDGHGQAYEDEADREGARLAARAGYDPYALARFIERTSKKDDRWGGKTHPPSSSRIRSIEMVLADYPYRGTDEALRRDRFWSTVGSR